MDFEDLLETVDSYGKYQQRLVWFFLVPFSVTAPFICMSDIFLLSSPAHWCHEPTVSSAGGITEQEKLDLVLPLNSEPNSLQSHDGCTMYNLNYSDVLEDLVKNDWNVSWYLKEYSANWTTMACKYGWDYDRSQYERTATSDWNLVCSDDHLPSLVLALLTLGCTIGTPIFGIVSDRIGRKPGFLATSIIGVVASILTALMPSFIGFLVIRVINGSIYPSVFQFPCIIITEIVSPKMRTRANAVFSIGWSVGLALMPLVAWLTADWIWYAWVCAAISLSYLIFYWALLESPRWLISREKFEEAKNILQKMAEVNGKDISQLDLIHLLKKCSYKEKSESSKMKVSRSDYFKKPTLFRRFIYITIIWSANSIVYYGFHLNLDGLYGNEFLDFFLLAMVELPAYVLTWVMTKSKLGRRWSNVIFLLITAVVCILPIMASEESKVFTTVASLVGKFGVSASYMIVYQQATEIFPTPLRSSGMSIASTLATAISASTPYLIYLGIYGRHIPYTVMSFICLLAGVCAVFLPETLNEILPQTLEDGESFGNGRKFFTLANKKIKPEAEITVDAPAANLPLLELPAPVCV